MRIECPGCRAAYDIPDAAIPDPGREVQCSACNHAWFLLRGGAAPRGGNSDGTADAAPAASPPDQPAPSGAIAEPAEGADDQAPPAPPRRKIDPAVLAILREEATVEAQARKAAQLGAVDPEPAAPPAPTQTPEAPSAAPETSRSGASDRLARLAAAERARPAETDPGDDGLVEDPHAAWRDPRPPLLGEASDAHVPFSPRQTLPVRTTAPDPVEVHRRQVGFRLGFAGTAGLCCAALALYLVAAEYGDQVLPFADQIMAQGDKVQSTLVDLFHRILATGVS
jgi:predicted Zn finger-like uncharacterized protein